MTPLTAIIADDEPAALDILAYRLARADIAVEIIATAQSGAAAHALILEKRPDVAFLDIQMPPPGGLEVAALLEDNHPTCIVFVTAYDNHAVEAFQVSAVDYLMKPVEEERLNACLRKLQDSRIKEQQRTAIALLLETMADAEKPVSGTQNAPALLQVKVGEGRVSIPLDSLSFLQASGDYVTLYYDTRSAFVRESLSAILDRLPPEIFVRTHRATAVNIGHVRFLHKKGTLSLLELADGRKVTVARSRRAMVESLLA